MKSPCMVLRTQITEHRPFATAEQVLCYSRAEAAPALSSTDDRVDPTAYRQSLFVRLFYGCGWIQRATWPRCFPHDRISYIQRHINCASVRCPPRPPPFPACAARPSVRVTRRSGSSGSNRRPTRSFTAGRSTSTARAVPTNSASTSGPGLEMLCCSSVDVGLSITCWS